MSPLSTQHLPSWLCNLSNLWREQAEYQRFQSNSWDLLNHIALSIYDVIKSPPLTTTSWHVISKNPDKQASIGPATRPQRSYRILLTCEQNSYQLRVPVILSELISRKNKKLNYAIDFSCELVGPLDHPTLSKVDVTATIYFRGKGYSSTQLGHLGIVCHEAIHQLALNVAIAATPTLYYVNPDRKIEWSQLRYAGDLEDVQHLTLDQHLSIAVAITQTLGALHKNNIFHRDITPKNIFVDRACHGFLGDFDHAERQLGELDQFFILKSRYPFWDQGAHQNIVSPFTDIYGLSVTLGLIVTRLLNFDPYEVFYPSLTGRPNQPVNLGRYRLFTKNILSSYHKQAILQERWKSPQLTPSITDEIRLLMATVHLFNFIDKVLQADITLKGRLHNKEQRRAWLTLLKSEFTIQEALEEIHTFAPSLEQLTSLLTSIQNYTPQESDIVNFPVSLITCDYDYRRLVKQHPLTERLQMPNG